MSRFRATDLSIFDDAEREHPAWTAFVVATTIKDRAPGRAALIAAWSWFKDGWQSHIELLEAA